ncbi:MAG TPA: sigma-70 family RNA polymerase sigma factor [Planctomycetota bacterium]|nr:sigma-70 family RNA polymerase sigma factor [Planctomycetota bacterium]
MEAARSGIPDAWTELVRRFVKPVHALCLRFVRNGAEAEDACQEVFVRLIQGISLYERTGRFAPWLFRLAANVCRNHLRSSGRRREREILTASDPEPVANPASEAERREAVVQLKDIIDSLPELYSVPMWLKFQQGFTNEEISQVLELPSSSVRVVLFRALSMVRDRAYSGRQPS